MLVGTIAKLLPEKGIGFITPCAPGGDVFFHCESLVGTQFEQLKYGQAVAFELEKPTAADDRPRAINVQLCDRKLLGRTSVGEAPLPRHPRARNRKPTWRD